MDKEVNFDVLNTLYLIKESLGDSYLDENFNPFGEDFVLNKNSVKHFLEVKAEKKQIKPPEFVDKSEREILNALRYGSLNAQKILQALEKTDKPSAQLNHIVVYLKIRLKMFEDLMKYALNYEELVDVMQTLDALDKNYAKILKKSFEKNFDVDLAIKHFMELCKAKQAEIAKKVEQKRQKEQTKTIHQEFVKNQIQPKTAVKKEPPKKKIKEDEMSM